MFKHLGVIWHLTFDIWYFTFDIEITEMILGQTYLIFMMMDSEVILAIWKRLVSQPVNNINLQSDQWVHIIDHNIDHLQNLP